MKPNFEEIPVVILCGGIGARLWEETIVLPKPLLKIGNAPILVHILCWSKIRSSVWRRIGRWVSMNTADFGSVWTRTKSWFLLNEMAAAGNTPWILKP